MNSIVPYEDLKRLNQPFEEAFQQQFREMLSSGWYILGKEVNQFEKDFGQYCGTRYFSGVASGLDALTIALKVFRFRKGSEVIVPSNTYVATILAIVNSGLIPRLVEPDIHTYNIDAQSVEDAINPKTVAIIPVHLYGKCCNMPAIMAVAKDHGLRVIEDAAQAHGACFKDLKAGSFGDFGAFSFYPTKNLGALGDGGGLATNDSELDAAVKMIRNYGSEKKYYNEVEGVNSRLDEIQAGFLNIKLRALDTINEHKRKLADRYFEGLSDRFVLPARETDAFDVYHIFNIRSQQRDQLKAHLDTCGIRTEIHYPVPPHQQKALKHLFDKSFPVSEEIHQTTLSLPVSFAHTPEDVDYVIECANKFLK